MDYNDFQEEYGKRIAELRLVAEKLEEILRSGLRQFLEDIEDGASHPARKFFRIRLQEVRVKECRSLYDKIMEEPDLELEEAFSPGHVHDLVGARVVCHNLRDIDEIAEHISKHIDEIEVVIESKGKEKDWTHKGHKQSGYRGRHLDVKIKMGRSKSYCAEIQIRTLLQDSWAQFMHDDIYKTQLRRILPPLVFNHFRNFSDLIYSLDRMAEDLRTLAEGATVLPNLAIRVLEARLYHMNAITAFDSGSLNVEKSYCQVSRKDRYVINENKVIFDFQIDASLKDKAKAFNMLIVGDTPAANNFSLESISKLSVNETEETLPADLCQIRYVEDRPNAVVVGVSKRGTKRHRYRVRCAWDGVFDEEIEYVMSPWKSHYPHADVNYTLELEFDKPPRRPPMVYRLSGAERLFDLVENFLTGGGDDGDPAVQSVDNRGIFSFYYDCMDKDMIVLFQR